MDIGHGLFFNVTVTDVSEVCACLVDFVPGSERSGCGLRFGCVVAQWLLYACSVIAP